MRVIRYTTLVVAVVALLFVWHLFNGHGTLVIGFVIAGLTFALQEVVGAVAGWFNILTGRIYRVGDRIEIAGVHGDVIDVTLLRTKLLEFGTATETTDDTAATWVHGRQYTGRIVFLSNKTTFTEAVFNYSAALDFIWEELTVPIPYGADWKLAEQILLEEAERISSGAEAQEAVRRLEAHYPVPKTEVEPRVFVQMTDNWMSSRRGSSSRCDRRARRRAR